MKVFQDNFQTKTPERLKNKPHTHKELQEAARDEVAANFPTNNPAEVHPFFYRDPYRYAAMVEKIMSYRNDGHFLRKAYRAFYTEETLGGLKYPDEW